MPLLAQSPYVTVATVEKTQGLHGELVIRYDTGLPFVLSEGMELWFVPPLLKQDCHGFVEWSDEAYPCSCITVSCADSISQASNLVSRKILIKRSSMAEAGDITSPARLIGRSVVCRQRGFLGTIDSILFTPANDVWCVIGPFGEVLIPVIDSVVLDIPAAWEQPIDVLLMKGLIDSEAEEGEK